MQPIPAKFERVIGILEEDTKKPISEGAVDRFSSTSERHISADERRQDILTEREIKRYFELQQEHNRIGKLISAIKRKYVRQNSRKRGELPDVDGA